MLRIIVEKNLPLDLQTLTEEAVRLYGSKLTNAKVVDEVVEFMLGRFRAWYQEEGHAVDTIQAVLARRPTKPADFDARVKAVSHFRTLDEAAALAAANKRVSSWRPTWWCCATSCSRTSRGQLPGSAGGTGCAA